MATNKAKSNSVKSKESADKSQFIDYTESEAYKTARELEKQFTPQELEQIRQEVKKEMMTKP